LINHCCLTIKESNDGSTPSLTRKDCCHSHLVPFSRAFPTAFLIIFILQCTSLLSAAQAQKKITLEDIFIKGTFRQKYIDGQRPLKDGKSYASIITDSQTGLSKVVRSRYSDGEISGTLYSESDIEPKGISVTTDFSSDEKKVVLARDEESIYRYSTKAWYYVYDLLSRKTEAVSKRGKQQFPSFSPDGTKLAYVIDNNIFIKDLNSGKERQITQDGKWNNIINGWSDWVYEEEFSFAQAFFWSQDGKEIAYYKFNESQVPLISLPFYNDNSYPTQYTYKYPRAGEKNSEVSIHVYRLQDSSSTKMEIGGERDQYIPRIKWTSESGNLCILRLNRHQNKLDYLLANSRTGQSRTILTERDKYYIDIEKERLTFLSDGRRFINVSERDGFNHIYLYDISGKVLYQVTKGNWEVTEIYGINESKGTIYYQSTEINPQQRDVFEISINGTHKRRLSKSPGENSAQFNSDYSYYILQHSSFNQPLYISLHQQNGTLIRVLQDNSELTTRLKDFKVPDAEMFNLKTSEGISLNGFMVKPSGFNPTKKYPVLLYTYGGPGYQSTTDTYSTSTYLWMRMLAQNGYIIACVDNRGTGYRGADFKKTTYKQLGKYETIDQIETARWFAKQSYVDKKRIGIWGWSFGGYLSSLCAEKGDGIFAMAIAVAPVTTWRFYDTIYTERFLLAPQENPSGYDDNSPIQFAKDLKGKFLLVHGTADDNVHPQNSMAFSEALIDANIPFEQAYYPNKNHGIYGGNTSLHLFSKLTDFVLKNL